MIIAREIMTPDPQVLEPATSIRDAARFLLDNDISGAPVVNEQDELVGILTKKDVIATVREAKMPRMLSFFDAIIYLESTEEYNEELQRMAATTVEQAMSRDVLTVKTDTSLSRLASLMSDNHIPMLPVVDVEGRLEGIISTTDILKAIAYAPDEAQES